MTAPTNTYSSDLRLALGQVPNGITDPVLYEELLAIHNAIEALITHTDEGDTSTDAYRDKRRNLKAVATDYLVLVTDGTILVNATSEDITISLDQVAIQLGYRYEIKRIDTNTAYKVDIVGNGTEYIDGHVDGVRLSTKSSYTVKATDTGWVIL